MNGGRTMNDNKPVCLEKFSCFLKSLDSKNINISSFQDPYNLEKFQYIIPYTDDMVDFLHDISEIPKEFTKQFIALNKLRYIVHAFPECISLHVTVDGNCLSIKLGNSLFRHNILGIDSHPTRGIIISCTYRNKTISNEFTYEDAYNKILKEVKDKINPKIVDSLSFLEFYRNTTDNVIQSKVNHVDVTYCSHSQFCKGYNKPSEENIFFIMPEMFDKFIKDMFPARTYKKLLHLMSLCELNFYLADRDIFQPVKIIFPPVSKYINHNTLVAFEFLDVTVSFLDDGDFYYENPIKDIPVYLHDIDDIYNHLLDETRQKISLRVETPVDKLTTRDLELYKIVVY
jgi:hypothetical protein